MEAHRLLTAQRAVDSTAALLTGRRMNTSKMLGLGAALVAAGAAGFHELDGMVVADAPGAIN